MSSGRQKCLKQALRSIEEFADKDVKARAVINKNGIDRESQVINSTAEWVFFMDEDCEIPGKIFFEKIKKLTLKKSKFSIYGGLYLDQPGSTYRSRAYNRLCNLWVLKACHADMALNLLGGSLLVHAPSVKSDLKNSPIAWGGEDTFLLRKLQEAGHLCSLEKDLSLIHNPPSTSFFQFVRRAFLHGSHREKFQLGSSGVNHKSWRYLFANFRYWPIWTLHFFFLQAGALNHSIGQASKRRR
jgi:hypothetical protein